MSEPASRPSLVRATLVSLLVAAIVLVTVVLPAEFGLDPLGTGEFLGLVGLAGGEQRAVTSESRPFRSDRMRFELAPFESVEYKYRLPPGGAAVYSWRATGEVVFDFHAEPDGAEPGFAESFERGRGTSSHGSFIAPYAGIHGWFWENRGAETVTVDLVSAGFFDRAIEFRDGDQTERVPGER